MARLFPKIEPSEIENPGERKVAEALISQLPSHVEVFHSFNWLTPTHRGTLQEGECDFVLLDRENGLLFVEVKGGSLEFFPDRGEWVRITSAGEERRLNKDPFAQAQKSMHEITERVKARLPGAGGGLPFTHGFAVAFPDCRYSGSLPPAIVPDLILDAARCRELGRAVQVVFDRFRRKAHAGLSSVEIEAIYEALFPKYAILPVIWRKVEDQEERLRRLTAEQQRLLDFLGGHNRAAIRGVAGSGKTILALAKAQETARKGMRTLFVCYNKLLKDWLQQSIPESFGDNLVIDNYHGLVDDLCRAAGVMLWKDANPKEQSFWSEHAPESLMKACEQLGPEHKFDAVIVDEGQDFQDLWWTSLEDVFRDPARKGCYYVFYDPNQNLFVEAPSIPGELGSPYDLPVNCRNTVRIAEHCAALVGLENHSLDSAPIGDEPEVIQVASLQDAFKEAGKKVRSWCMPNAGGLKLAQVAVLAPGGTDRAWPRDFKTIAIARDLDKWRGSEGVLLTSWSRFKGLEADAIVLIEAPTADAEHEKANRYVARSRAKHLLTIVNVTNATT
ncbi:MAG: NERD domain-containing protein [Chromatiales bacterium]|nr:NERD domain-containing protein [Chromatiales bacterium]